MKVTGFPRASGGDPYFEANGSEFFQFSPRKRG